jgi:hypothetical protein
MKFFLCFAVAFTALTSTAHAAPTTRAQIVKNHQMCMRYLKLSPAQKRAFASRTVHSAETITKSCRFTTGMGVDKTWYYERMYQRETARGGSSRGGSERPRRNESSAGTAGTCYFMSDCYGSSVHVSSKSSCPGGYGAFKPDLGGGGCEVR